LVDEGGRKIHQETKETVERPRRENDGTAADQIKSVEQNFPWIYKKPKLPISETLQKQSCSLTRYADFIEICRFYDKKIAD
jgi:hypothetical protein